MKRAIALIAATLLSTSIYSQDYSSSSSSASSQTTDPAGQQEQTPNYQSRQTESGAPATGESSQSISGYDREPGASGGNNTTGQSNGANLGSAADQDQTLTTRDSDLNGSEYRGHPDSEPARSFNSELSTESSSTSSQGSFSSGVSGSLSSSDRDQDLSSRGLEPDSAQLSEDNSNLNRVEGDMDDDSVLIFEDWTVIEPQQNVGAPAESESGASSSSDEKPLDNRDHFDSTQRSSGSAMSGESLSSSSADSDYARDLYQRTQRDWNARGNGDMPESSSVFDKSLDELTQMEIYNGTSQSTSVGGPASSVSGSATSHDDSDCDTHKGSAAEFEQGRDDSDLDGRVKSSGAAIGNEERTQSDQQKYHINRGDDEKYHINRDASRDRSTSDSGTTAPSDYGERSSSVSQDDGYLSGNNATDSSSSDNSSDSSNSNSSDTDTSVTPPDL